MCVVPTVNSGGLSLISKMDTVTVVVPLAEEGRQEQKVHQPVLKHIHGKHDLSIQNSLLHSLHAQYHILIAELRSRMDSLPDRKRHHFFQTYIYSSQASHWAM